MRRKIRYIVTAFVLLWLTVSVVYLLPFLVAPKEGPTFVSLSAVSMYSPIIVLAFRVTPPRFAFAGTIYLVHVTSSRPVLSDASFTILCV